MCSVRSLDFIEPFTILWKNTWLWIRRRSRRKAMLWIMNPCSARRDVLWNVRKVSEKGSLYTFHSLWMDSIKKILNKNYLESLHYYNLLRTRALYNTIRVFWSFKFQEYLAAIISSDATAHLRPVQHYFGYLSISFRYNPLVRV